MKASSNSGPPMPIEGEKKEDRTRLGRIKKAFRGVKSKFKNEQKTKIKSSGIMRGQWSQKELPRIVKKIVDTNPGITNIEIYATEIRWHCEVNYFDLFPKKKGNENPSKREDDKRI
jgi:hypothetical protein